MTKLTLRTLARLVMASLATSAIGASSCSFNSYGDDGVSDGDDGLSPSAAVFHFKMRGDVSGVQDFRAATEDPAVIAMARGQLAKPVAERNLFISGPIERGNGGHNLSWRWHFVPDAWQLTAAAIEPCDGNAVIVDQAVGYWVEIVGSFCPWGSYVAAEIGPVN